MHGSNSPRSDAQKWALAAAGGSVGSNMLWNVASKAKARP